MIDFDVGNARVQKIEFGIGSDYGDGKSYFAVAVDLGVKGALNEMVGDTIKTMQELVTAPKPFDPAEKYAGLEYVYIPVDSELASSITQLHKAVDLEPNNAAIADTESIFCYFTRLIDSQDRRLTAVRQAAQFKGVLKSQGRLLRYVTPALQIIADKVFKLDVDFDFLVDDRNIHILRPSSFVFTANLKEAVLKAVPQNRERIERDLPSVDFSNIADYASEHPRAARYLAAIQTQKEAKNIDRKSLIQQCALNGVKIDTSGVQIVVDDDHIMGFLEVLDRRRYEIELVKGSPERYKAASRERV